MSCQRCQSQRINSVTAKCSDLCGGNVKGRDYEGYVPADLGIGGGDYVEFSYCMDCGQMQNNFPLPQSTIEKDLEDSDLMDFFLNWDLEPAGFKFRESFWNMVDAANKMSAPFGSFLQNEFETQVQGLSNKVSGYKSPFNSWDELFKAYRNYVAR